MQKVEAPMKIMAKHVEECKSETDCKYVCSEMLNSKEGGLKMDKIEEPGSLKDFSSKLDTTRLL